MKYNIISINDDRAGYKENIRKYAALEEVKIKSVNARAVDLAQEIDARGLRLTTWPGEVGELGVWLSNFDCWQWATDNGDLLVFEDDAVIGPAFSAKREGMMQDLPEDWDFIALWVPDNQKIDYTYELTYDENGDAIITGRRPHQDSLFKYTFKLAKVYQGYGMVSLAYSKKGAAKLVDIAKDKGICGPVDCFIYQQAHLGNLKGFAPTPVYANVVGYDWKATTTVHNTGEFSAV